MKYVLMIYHSPTFDAKKLSKEEHAEIAVEYRAVSATANATPGPPLGLPEQATTVRVKDGVVSPSPGPYVAVAGGAVGGFLILEAESLDDAVSVAAKIPAARLGGAIEVRPCAVYW